MPDATQLLPLVDSAPFGCVAPSATHPLVCSSESCAERDAAGGARSRPGQLMVPALLVSAAGHCLAACSGDGGDGAARLPLLLPGLVGESENELGVAGATSLQGRGGGRPSAATPPPPPQLGSARPVVALAWVGHRMGP